MSSGVQQKIDGTTMSPTASETDAEFQSLLDEIQKVESKYKLGDVDGKINPPNAASQFKWEFDDKINKLDPLVRKYKARLIAECPSWFFKFIAIQAEAKEYFDTATPSYRLDLYLQGQYLYRQLPKRVPSDDGETESEKRKSFKNIVRVIIAGLEYLHTTGEFDAAIACAEGLNEFVNNSGLATKDNPAFGTRAVITYFLGRTHRQRGIDQDYQKAIDYFYQSSEYYFEMARRRGNKDNDDVSEDVSEDISEDVIYGRTRAMVSLAFGAGFLFYNAQSDLARAKGLIAQARLAFLKDNSKICCKLHYFYLELLYASILRAEAGEINWDKADTGTQSEADHVAAEDKLDHALEILGRCKKVLVDKPKYYTHVLFNQALVYIYKGSDFYQQARDCINDLMQRCQDNPRWLANALILKSHLERRVGAVDIALDDAVRAYNQAGNHLPVLIEALLARGQAQFGRGNLPSARADFEKAYQLNGGSNKKLEVMALLLLVEIAIAQQQPQVALERFAHAKVIIPSIKHGFVLNKYRTLEVLIDGYQADFVIPSRTQNLDYQTHETALRRWLLEMAMREDSNITRVAQRLNVSKKTLYQWRETYAK